MADLESVPGEPLQKHVLPFSQSYVSQRPGNDQLRIVNNTLPEDQLLLSGLLEFWNKRQR